MDIENSTTIKLLEIVGLFAENKDTGRSIRIDKIEPALAKGKQIVLDFEGIEGTTQSFIHSMISQVIRDHGNGIIDSLYFKNCSEAVRAIINIVVDYMQQTD
jgi:hypothetical protein